MFLVGEGGAEEGEGDKVGFRGTGYGLSLTRIRTNIRSFALLRMTVFKSRFAVVCTTGFTVAAAEFVGKVFTGFCVDVPDETFFIAGGTGEFFWGGVEGVFVGHWSLVIGY